MSKKNQQRKIDQKANIRNIHGNVYPEWVPPAFPLKVLFVASFFLSGLFYDWLSCLVSLYLLIYLFYCFLKGRNLKLMYTPSFFAALVLVIFFGLASFWGIDRGMAPFGFVKFMPVPLFLLSVFQLKDKSRRSLLELLPHAGAVMTLLSFLLGLIPFLNSFFFVNNRLGGFMQYPNTFGLFLLLGIAVLVTSEEWSIKKSICLLILLGGILLSGSRTVFVLLIMLAVYCIFRLKDKRIRLTMAIAPILLIAAAAIYVLITSNTSLISRYLTAPLSSSTFLGRLLYFKDVLPVIASHPLGLGYLGYYFMQGSFQTGVYSVQNIHNELLQVLLDVGWIPAVFLIFATAQGLRCGDRRSRLLLILITAHSMFDFDFQFISIAFLFFMVMEPKEMSRCIIIKRKALVSGLAVILGCVSLYFGIASGLYFMGQISKCIALYPGHTNAWIARLTDAEEPEEMERIADHILHLNSSVSLAYTAKARAAYAAGDFSSMITYKQEAIRLSKYSLEEYLDYFDMLYIGVYLYESNGDSYSADYCAMALLDIPEMLREVEESTDSIGWKIYDKPDLTLPVEYQEKLNTLDRER